MQRHRNETAYMPANDDRPQLKGAGIVKVMIMTLAFLLIEARFGMPMSLLTFGCALALAAGLHFLWQAVAHRWASRR